MESILLQRAKYHFVIISRKYIEKCQNRLLPANNQSKGEDRKRWGNIVEISGLLYDCCTGNSINFACKRGVKA